MIQVVGPEAEASRSRPFAARAAAVVLGCALVVGVAACTGKSGGGDGTAGSDGTLQDTTNVADDRYLGNGPDSDGTGSVPHVVIVAPLPGADASKDVAADHSDLAGS